MGLAIKAAGLLYTFGYLVLPASVARRLCREVREMSLVVPAAALLVGAVGFALANECDYPPVQIMVVLLGLTPSTRGLASGRGERKVTLPEAGRVPRAAVPGREK